MTKDTTRNIGHQFHCWTEQPGSLLPLDTHRVIQHRYQCAKTISAGKRVLEVGSGAGMGLRYLANIAKYIIGCELSTDNIKIARSKNPTAAIVAADAHCLPFCKGSFDVILAMAMIYYLSLEKFLAEARHVLSDGGTLFFCTSNKDVPGFVAAPYTTKYYSIPELNRILIKSGFRPKFYGAFMAHNGKISFLRLRAAVKELLKRFSLMMPYGARLWEKLRLISLGKFSALPWEIEVEDLSNIEYTMLDPQKVDRVYRVIYVEAEMV